MNKYNNDFIKDMNNILEQNNINDKFNGMIILYNSIVPEKEKKRYYYQKRSNKYN